MSEDKFGYPFMRMISTGPRENGGGGGMGTKVGQRELVGRWWILWTGHVLDSWLVDCVDEES